MSLNDICKKIISASFQEMAQVSFWNGVIMDLEFIIEQNSTDEARKLLNQSLEARQVLIDRIREQKAQ